MNSDTDTPTNWNTKFSTPAFIIFFFFFLGGREGGQWHILDVALQNENDHDNNRGSLSILVFVICNYSLFVFSFIFRSIFFFLSHSCAPKWSCFNYIKQHGFKTFSTKSLLSNEIAAHFYFFFLFFFFSFYAGFSVVCLCMCKSFFFVCYESRSPWIGLKCRLFSIQWKQQLTFGRWRILFFFSSLCSNSKGNTKMKSWFFFLVSFHYSSSNKLR